LGGGGGERSAKEKRARTTRAVFFTRIKGGKLQLQFFPTNGKKRRGGPGGDGAFARVENHPGRPKKHARMGKAEKSLSKRIDTEKKGSTKQIDSMEPPKLQDNGGKGSS